MPLFTDDDRLKDVQVGQEVITRYGPEKTSGIRCVVKAVVGPTICIENKKRKYKVWIIVTDLYPYDERVKNFIRKPKQVENTNLSSDFAEMVNSMLFVQA